MTKLEQIMQDQIGVYDSNTRAAFKIGANSMLALFEEWIEGTKAETKNDGVGRCVSCTNSFRQELRRKIGEMK